MSVQLCGSHAAVAQALVVGSGKLLVGGNLALRQIGHDNVSVVTLAHRQVRVLGLKEVVHLWEKTKAVAQRWR